jgi:hypothetical protein
MELKKGFNSQGWKQFLTYRKEILDAYDQAKIKGELRKVKVHHGNVVEAEFRRWLKEFLPKRFAVTSGYVISQGIGSKTKAPHYDVIIYDALNSPVLWIENNPDSSSDGKSKAIPAEHVFGILEIKSSFNPKTVADALEHLKELKPLMEGIDDYEERYKTYLPPNFFCATVFCELREKYRRSEKAFNSLANHYDLRRFCGGLILRKEKANNNSSGRLMSILADRPIMKGEGSMHFSELNLFDNIVSKPLEIGEGKYISMMIGWSEMYFAQFAFDLIALMNGTYKINMLSSMHAIGMSGYEK